MVQHELLTVFVAVTALAVFIQTGIVAGMFFLSRKMTRQALRAVQTARQMTGPLHSLAENAEEVSTHISEWTRGARGQVRRFER